MNRYPLMSARNFPAYATVILLWAVVSVALAIILRTMIGSLVGLTTAFVFAAVSVMAGMMIMFGASAVNLRKLRPGFTRLAEGASDPEIPPVWCPVLTMATRAAVILGETVRERRGRETSG